MMFGVYKTTAYAGKVLQSTFAAVSDARQEIYKTACQEGVFFDYYYGDTLKIGGNGSTRLYTIEGIETRKRCDNDKR